MPHSIQRAQPPLEFIPQQFDPLVHYIMQGLLPILQRLRLRPWLPTGIAKIETENVEVLVDLYQQFQAGKIRFLIAFRHCEVDDPLSMLYLLSRAVPKVARKIGVTLQYPIHSYFLYDRGMLLWAGNWLGWLFSRLGGVPIHRGKRLDRSGMRTARDLFANGKLPISVAPEGATNGHSETVSPLEPGVAHLGFWCQQDLLKANRTESVLIVPIGIQYSYINPSWAKLDWLLSKLEADSGLPVQQIDRSNLVEPEKFYHRLFRLGEHVLSQMEQFYTRFYHQAPVNTPIDSSAHRNQVLKARLQTVLDKSLQAAEQYFGLESQGTIIERCRRIESACWDDIYRNDLPSLHNLSPIERGLADWIAEEASLRVLHMRLAESFVAVTGTYVQQKPTFERFAETTLILFDLIARIKGEKNPARPRLGWRKSQVTVGEPISVTERWSSYHIGRQGARQAVDDLTKDLQIALEKMIS
ncbi:lysophospholipid acyltransferase family protein [Iningainema tapete]|uniref:1-acyl-sn-glycerol-3-phosphate acyltransferase n=1 Tax=Iningainema tapete BLCC-T55 TaxID=2748662 RepID=A0A8J6XJ45_9CYAN|nr:1-acyl-sn-glycerol-3-phosphate acyltransferase [Iningainema tapete]MBD2771711.1 1-acyl-sn-glycerol-3-phosphate acyltransferase [Iningainema tapete BLCC-T55]